MKSVSMIAIVAASMAAGVPTAYAADMSFERALSADREPQNWLLHHKNYQGHRFSALKEIDTGTVANLRLAFTVGLGGLQAGGRYANGNLEATPLVDDGIMYIPDGWGAVYAIDVRSGRKGEIKWKFDPGVDRVWAGDVACCGVNNRGVALWKDKVISVALDGRRVRHPRLDRCHRPQHRQAGLAHFHDSGRRRAWPRDLERRQGALEAR